MSRTKVDGGSPTPLYHQIYLILRDRIADGGLPLGAIVPGENDLARQFGVSRITAKRALDELADRGLVVRARGRGTHVAHRAQAEPIRAGVEGLLENLIDMGLKTEVKLLSFAYAPAPPDAARALQIEPGAPVQHAVRSRSLAAGPFSHLTTFVPEAIGRTFTRRDLAATPLLALLERSGVRIGSAQQTIAATLAGPDVASILQVAIGSPLLRISRIVFDQQDRPVEYIVGLYRPDRYQYRMKLDRVQERKGNSWLPAA